MSQIDETIFPSNINEEVEQSYINYAMSVITDRALPDVKDGLKPVHRRIIWTAFEDGLASNKPYKKSASIVGNTMGRYHAHGDSSVYDAMVRLSQDFTMRYPLIDGHGAFGDRDGNPQAHMRYTEARLSKVAEDMVKDIKKNTIEWQPNYAEDREEPVYLTSSFPNVLVNPVIGIAVAMACSIVPHNIVNVYDVVKAYVENPEISMKEIMSLLVGPDFPTGGLIINQKELLEGYSTGRGRVRIRGKYEILTRKSKTLINFYETPYMVKTTKLIEDIVKLCESKVLEGITDVRDESDTKMSIIIEVAKGFDPENIVKVLFAKTQLEDTYSINNTVLVDGSPKVLSFKQLVEEYVKHRRTIIRRRTEFEIQKVIDKLEILNGLIIALANIDEVIKIIKQSNSSAIAQTELEKRFGLSERQSKAILDMKLARLTKLQIQELKDEIKELEVKKIKLELILSSPAELDRIFLTELKEIRDRYKDDRRTEITQIDKETIKKEKETIIDKPIIIAIDKNMNIKIVENKTFKNKKNSDQYQYILHTSTASSIYSISNLGKVYRVPITDLKDGTNLISILEIKDEKIIDIIKEGAAKYLLFLTKNGMIKKTLLEEYSSIKRNGTIGIKLKENDQLVKIGFINDENIIIFTNQGMSLRCDSTLVTSTGRNTIGVIGIKLKDGDFASTFCSVNDKEFILTATKNGYVKKTSITEYSLQSRSGIGIIGCKVMEKDILVDATAVNESDTILIYSDTSLTKITGSDAPTLNRSAQGNRISKNGNVININII